MTGKVRVKIFCIDSKHYIVFSILIVNIHTVHTIVYSIDFIFYYNLLYYVFYY